MISESGARIAALENPEVQNQRQERYVDGQQEHYTGLLRDERVFQQLDLAADALNVLLQENGGEGQKNHRQHNQDF